MVVDDTADNEADRKSKEKSLAMTSSRIDLSDG
jgi:hypothetical protein